MFCEPRLLRSEGHVTHQGTALLSPSIFYDLVCCLTEALQGQKRTDNEDGSREIDQAEVPDRCKSPRIVRRERDGEAEHRCCDRGDPSPHAAAPDAEPGERGDRETGRGDEARDGDMEMADVVVEIGAERLDLVFALVDLASADPELQEAVGEVPDEEQRRITDERDGAEGHE